MIDQGVLVNILMGAIAALTSAIAFMYREDSKFKTGLINRLLDTQERQADQQQEQTNISRGVVDRTLGPDRSRR